MNRDNLIKLRNGLADLPDDYGDFDMSNYYGHVWLAGGANMPPHSCGAVACAMGHAPSIVTPAFPGEEWRSYSGRVFGITDIDSEWEWLFSAEWGDFDNTLTGTVKRIDYYLSNGVPAAFDPEPRHLFNDCDFNAGLAAYAL